MRIVVASDSHGMYMYLRKALEREPEAELFIFLGDGEADYRLATETGFPALPKIAVKGNCDVYSALPESEFKCVANKKIYATHGYKEHVKYGLFDLEHIAKETGTDIVLFGHTHTPLYRCSEGVHYFNPGSIQQRQFGVIDITPAGDVMCINKEIPFLK